MPKPHDGPARPCLLLRVSTDEQDMTQQEREARQYCSDAYDVTLPESSVFREHGVSGSKNAFEQRPELKRAVEACERGEYTHFIVHKLDRSARSLRVFTEVWDRLARANVAFVAIVEGIDSSRGDSTMTAQILAVTSEFFSRNLSREIKKGHRGRIYRGRQNGLPPYGYHIVNGDWVPDLREIAEHPSSTPVSIVQRMYQEADAGWTPTEIAKKLNRQEYHIVTIHNGANSWSRNSAARILRNRFYIGEVRDIPDESGNRGWRTGDHKAIIDVDLFARVQTQLAVHSLHPRTVPQTTWDGAFYGGILRCAFCRDSGARHTSYHRQSNYRYRDMNTFYYACSNRIKQMCNCPEKAVREDRLIAQVGLYLERWQAEPELIDAAIARYREQYTETDQSVIAAKQRERIKKQLKRLADLYAWGDIEESNYLQQKAALKEQELSIVVNEPHPLSEDLFLQIAATMRHIKTAWDMANSKQKAELVRLLFRTIWIRGGVIERIEPQPHYKMFFGGEDV
jgi:DNA invertase Pin-like site-specific DNA recombinase